MKIKILLFAASFLSLAPLAHCEEVDKIAYPTAENASFVISVPSDWKMTQAEEEGDFFHLDGPTGAVFSFRTIKGSEDSLKAAIDDSVQELDKKFDDVELDDPQDWKPDGLSGFYAVGKGKEKKDGTPVRVGLAWCALNDGKIAEMWFVCDLTDNEGMSAAEKIVNSLQSP